MIGDFLTIVVEVVGDIRGVKITHFLAKLVLVKFAANGRMQIQHPLVGIE